jgi:hypothetical protein
MAHLNSDESQHAPSPPPLPHQGGGAGLPRGRGLGGSSPNSCWLRLVANQYGSWLVLDSVNTTLGPAAFRSAARSERASPLPAPEKLTMSVHMAFAAARSSFPLDAAPVASAGRDGK